MEVIAPEELKGARKKAGMTQTELAKAAGTTQVQVSRIETGAQQPQYKTLCKLTKALLDPSERRVFEYINIATKKVQRINVTSERSIISDSGVIYKILYFDGGRITINTGQKALVS